MLPEIPLLREAGASPSQTRPLDTAAKATPLEAVSSICPLQAVDRMSYNPAEGRGPRSQVLPAGQRIAGPPCASWEAAPLAPCVSRHGSLPDAGSWWDGGRQGGLAPPWERDAAALCLGRDAQGMPGQHSGASASGVSSGAASDPVSADPVLITGAAARSSMQREGGSRPTSMEDTIAMQQRHIEELTREVAWLRSQYSAVMERLLASQDPSPNPFQRESPGYALVGGEALSRPSSAEQCPAAPGGGAAVASARPEGQGQERMGASPTPPAPTFPSDTASHSRPGPAGEQEPATAEREEFGDERSSDRLPCSEPVQDVRFRCLRDPIEDAATSSSVCVDGEILINSVPEEVQAEAGSMLVSSVLEVLHRTVASADAHDQGSSAAERFDAFMEASFGQGVFPRDSESKEEAQEGAGRVADPNPPPAASGSLSVCRAGSGNDDVARVPDLSSLFPESDTEEWQGKSALQHWDLNGAHETALALLEDEEFSFTTQHFLEKYGRCDATRSVQRGEHQVQQVNTAVLPPATTDQGDTASGGIPHLPAMSEKDETCEQRGCNARDSKIWNSECPSYDMDPSDRTINPSCQARSRRFDVTQDIGWYSLDCILSGLEENKE
uniref:Uncharacterized protein n=1 Tax=Tetraselmis sp. GSL018 TaxID=582737 RepID=A0A061RS63_9CHLO